MKTWKAIFESLRAKYFPTKEDTAWKQWVDYEERQSKDLVELLSADVKESFKRRALFLLLVPLARHNPIYWTREVGKFYHDTKFLALLSESLRSYAAELVVEFCGMLKPSHNPIPEHHVAGGEGIAVHMDVPDEYHDALCFYANCILKLLPTATEPLAQQLFTLFPLNDISVFANFDDSSGYNPFSYLLRDEQIHEKWKKQADGAMREIIRAEIKGQAKPRTDHEVALRCYAEMVDSSLYSGGLKYPVELWASQLQFIMENRQHSNDCLIRSWDIVKMFQRLAGDAHQELRHTIARYTVLEGKETGGWFSVFNEETRQAANVMLKEFGAIDLELAKRLQALIKRDEQLAREATESETQRQQAEENILAQMK